MPAALAALRFLLRSAGLPGPRVPPRPARFEAAGETLVGLEFLPPRPRGRLLFLHGMTLRGPADPRQVAACEVLAGLGFHVRAPRLEEIARARIEPASVQRIAALVESEGRQGPLSVMSASFTASLALLAASRPPTARHLRAICAIGPYADLHGFLRFVMSAPEADPYGRLVVFANLLPRLEDRPALRAALWEAVADESFRRARPRLPRLRAGLDPVERELLDHIRAGSAALGPLADALVARSPDLLERLDLLPRAPGITPFTVLIHGERDPVIPAAHSARLHAARRAAGLPGHLELTPLLDHGDAQWSAATVARLPGLHRAFQAFFAAARAGPRP